MQRRNSGLLDMIALGDVGARFQGGAGLFGSGAACAAAGSAAQCTAILDRGDLGAGCPTHPAWRNWQAR